MMNRKGYHALHTCFPPLASHPQDPRKKEKGIRGRRKKSVRQKRKKADDREKANPETEAVGQHDLPPPPPA